MEKGRCGPCCSTEPTHSATTQSPAAANSGQVIRIISFAIISPPQYFLRWSTWATLTSVIEMQKTTVPIALMVGLTPLRITL